MIPTVRSAASLARIPRLPWLHQKHHNGPIQIPVLSSLRQQYQSFSSSGKNDHNSNSNNENKNVPDNVAFVDSSKLHDGSKKKKKRTVQQPIAPAPLLESTGYWSPLVHQVTITCQPGLQGVLSSELTHLGISHDAASIPSSKNHSNHTVLSPKFNHPITLHPPLNLHSIAQCHLFLGTAHHIRVLLFTDGQKRPFMIVRALGELQRKIASLPWHQVLQIPTAPLEASSSGNNKSSTSSENDHDTYPVPCHIKVTASKSRLYHTGAIHERVLNGINKALQKKSHHFLSDQTEHSSSEKKPQLVHVSTSTPASLSDDKNNDKIHTSNNQTKKSLPVFSLSVQLENNEVQLWLESSTTPLHQRGYRLNVAKAPLREDLAYGMLYNAGWMPKYYHQQQRTMNEIDNPQDSDTQHNTSSMMTGKPTFTALLDPFCGSGTLAIEAACMQRGLPPGRLRKHAPFEGTPWYNPVQWNNMKNRALAAATTSHTDDENDDKIISRQIPIACSDRNEGAIQAVQANAERAGVLSDLLISKDSMSNHPWLQKGAMPNKRTHLLICTNPPFGKRLQQSSKKSDLLPLFQTLSMCLKQNLDCTYTAAILTNKPVIVKQGGLNNAKPNLKFHHGDLAVASMLATNLNETSEASSIEEESLEEEVPEAMEEATVAAS